MKTFLLSSLLVAFPAVLLAQGPVMIGGGTTSPQPVMGMRTSTRTVITRVVFTQDVNPLNPYATASMNVGAEAPVVSEVAVSTYTPVHYSSACYDSSPHYRSACASSPVIFFGRGESCRRGYAFARHR